MGVSGDDGAGHRFIQGTSEFLAGKTWTIVVTVVNDGTSGSCLYESGGDGGDPGFLTGKL